MWTSILITELRCSPDTLLTGVKNQACGHVIFIIEWAVHAFFCTDIIDSRAVEISSLNMMFSGLQSTNFNATPQV